AALDLIAYWDTGAPSYRWNEIAVSEALRSNLPVNFASRVLAMLHVAMHDAIIATWDSKYAYNRRHPSEVDATLSTVLSNSRSPSYPAEHAAAAGAAAAVLSYLFPDRAPLFAKHAEEATRSRLLAGVSYPSDIAAGLEIGHRVVAKVIERGKADGSDAKWTGSVPVGPGKWTGTNPILPMAATWKPWVLASPGEFRPAPPTAHDSPERAAKSLNSRPTDVPPRPMPTHSSGNMRWAVSAITNTGTRTSAACTSNISSTQILPGRHVLTPSRAWRSMTPQ